MLSLGNDEGGSDGCIVGFRMHPFTPPPFTPLAILHLRLHPFTASTHTPAGSPLLRS